MTAPSGTAYEISAAGYVAAITEAGATLRSLTMDGRDVIEPFGAEEMCGRGRGQVLAPWPNRVRDGRWTHAGQTLQLPLSEPARHNASHGLVRWASWQPAAQATDAVTLGLRLLAQPGYPWTLDLTLRYALGEAGLSVALDATNASATPAPFAAGFHPYLMAGSGHVDGDMLTIAADTHLRVDAERLLPTGREPVDGSAYDFRGGRAVGAGALDDAFTDLTDRTVTLAGAAGRTELTLGPAIRWVQAFVFDDGSPASRRSVAVEPMTAPPDAFNSGEDLLVITPGETTEVTWGLRHRPA